MRIGFDGTCLPNRRGFGRFSRLLLEALAHRQTAEHQIVVIIDSPSADLATVPEEMECVKVKLAEAPSAAASAQGRRRLGDMLAMGKAVARQRLDLMYFPASYTFFPVWNVPHLVVTMHDTLALAHPELVFPTRKGRLAWLLKEHAAARFASRIVTVSETSKRDLKAWFGLPDGKVRVITEGPDPIFQPRPRDPDGEQVLRKFGLDPGARFLLYVGGLSPHKNLPRLIEAFWCLHATDTRLLLVGDLSDVFHTHVPEIRATIQRLGLAERVLLTGYLPDSELVHLYSRARALVVPSLLEGFGLPAVEAMACGTPVVSSRAGSLPEVVGNGGIFFDPMRIDSMALAMSQILADESLRNVHARTARKRSMMFSWDRAAEALLDCFDEFASRRIRRDRGTQRGKMILHPTRTPQATEPSEP
ncbi:MAG: glycosyltransferase family 4 protein [Isosphaeraceae bacterium]